MTITDSYSESSYLAGLTCNMDVRAHIGRSTGRSTPQKWHLVVKWHLAVKNGNMTFLLLELILSDQLADTPPVECKASWDVYCGMYLPAIVDS